MLTGKQAKIMGGTVSPEATLFSSIHVICKKKKSQLTVPNISLSGDPDYLLINNKEMGCAEWKSVLGARVRSAGSSTHIH